LKYCSFLDMPPKRNAHPRTKSMFERIEPSKDNWTTRNNPAFKAYMETIISVAFPNDAFNKPPTVEFVYPANCSVTNPRRSANGQIAINEKVKVKPSPQPPPLEIIASGTHTSK